MASSKIIEREIAIAAGLHKFIWACNFHGLTQYDAHFGHCDLCNLANQHVPPRIRAQIAGSIIYTDQCATHGEGDHDAKSGRCMACFDRYGRPRKGTQNPARAAARRAGERQFIATCTTHGETAHSVAHGKCLSCFTAMGAKRQWARVEP